MSTTNSIFDFNPRTLWANTTPLNTCKALSLVLGLHMFQVGAWVFYEPISCTKAFGLRYDGKPFHSTITSEDKTPKAGQPKQDESIYWPHLFACREVGFGGLILIFAAMGEWKSVGVVTSVVAGLLATTDGVATGIYGKDGWRGAFLGHGVPAIVLGAVAGGILML